MTIRVDDEVWAEVFAAASRYERQRVSLGEEFIAAVEKGRRDRSIPVRFRSIRLLLATALAHHHQE